MRRSLDSGKIKSIDEKGLNLELSDNIIGFIQKTNLAKDKLEQKIERFAVISGNAEIELRKIGEEKTIKFNFDGHNPSYIDMPVWHTHNMKNVGQKPLVTLFWINEFYDENDPDTFFEKV